MELKSEPKYDLVNVTDVDIAFPGDLQTYCLWEGRDTMTQDGAILFITLGTTGTLQFHLQHAHWLAIRTRVLRVAQAPATSEAHPSHTERTS